MTNDVTEARAAGRAARDELHTPEWTQDPPGQPDWARIQRGLARMFEPHEIEWRIQGGARKKQYGGRDVEVAVVVAYIDRAALIRRLDEVVGPQNWDFDWEPIVVEGNHVTQAKGWITIHGVRKAEVGSAGHPRKNDLHRTKTTITDTRKRAGSGWQVGLYLSNIGVTTAVVEEGWRDDKEITEGAEAELRRRLAAWDGRPGTFPGGRTPAGGGGGQSHQGSQGGQGNTNGANGHHSTQGAASATTTPPPATTSAPKGSQGQPARTPNPSTPTAPATPATDQQLVSIRKLCQALGRPEPEPGLTQAAAGQLLTRLSAEYQQRKREPQG